MRSGMEIKIRATINSTARAPSAENKDVNKFDSPKLCVEQLQTKRGKCRSDMKIKSGATTLVPADFNIQKIPGSNSFPNSFKHIQSASKASSLRPVLQGNSSSKRLSYVNTSPVLDGNASQNQLMKPSGLRMPSPSLSLFSQPKRSMFQDLPLRGNENIVCGSQKPENSSLQDNWRRTPKRHSNIPIKSIECIPMQKISDISKNRFGELHKVDIELPSVGGSCEQVMDGKVNGKTIEGYGDSACKPYHQLHRKTTDPCVFEGASTPSNNLGDGLKEKNGLSSLPQNAIPFSDEWLTDIEAARKEHERRQIQVVGTSFEKVLSGMPVAAAVRETPLVLWRHGSMLIADSFEGNVITSADNKSTTEESKMRKGLKGDVTIDFNMQKISRSKSFPKSSASKASSLRPARYKDGNSVNASSCRLSSVNTDGWLSSAKKLSSDNTKQVLDGNNDYSGLEMISDIMNPARPTMHLSQNQPIKPPGLRMPSPSLSFFSQPKRSVFQDLPLRGNKNIVCGSEKPENSRLRDNLRTPKRHRKIPASAIITSKIKNSIERIPMHKISDISKNRFGELHKVDIELPSVGGSCEQVMDGKVNWKTIEGYRDSACEPYNQLHRKTTDPCVFEGASTPSNNLGDGLKEKNGLSVPPQNAFPFSDEWLIDIEAARKERERRQIQVVGTSFEKVLSVPSDCINGTTVAAAVRETPVVLWRHGSMLIAGSFEGNVIISADTRSTTEEPKRKKGLKGDVTIDDGQSKINCIEVHGDQILAAFVGDNGLYDLAVDHVTTICKKARSKRVPFSLLDLAKQIYIQLKEIELTEKNQGVDILLATFVNKKVSMVKIVVNPPHTRNEHPPGAFDITSEELKNIVVLGADQKLVKTMIKKRHKKVKDFAGFKDMVIHGVLISSLAHGCTGGAIEAWQMRNGWMKTIFHFPVIKQYLERFKDLENENKALLIIVPTYSSSKITCGDIVIQFRCGRVQPICMFLGRINNLDIFRLWFRRVEDATCALEGLEEFNSISRIPKFESYVLSQVGKVGCLVKIAKRQFVEHLLFRLKKSVEYGPHSGDLTGLLTEKKFSLHGRIK